MAEIIRVLRTHPAQNIRPLLNHIRFQHSHLYTTKRPNIDPDRDNPQSPLTHALHNVTRSLNIPSFHHSLASPLPIDSQLSIDTAAPLPGAFGLLSLSLYQILRVYVNTISFFGQL